VPRSIKLTLLVAFGSVALVAMTGCSGWSSEPSPSESALASNSAIASTAPAPASNSATASTAPTPSPDAPEELFTEEALLAELPSGSNIETFQYALGSPYMWAAVQVKSNSEVYFMRSNGPWELVDTSDACGSGDDQAPEELLSMCPES